MRTPMRPPKPPLFFSPFIFTGNGPKNHENDLNCSSLSAPATAPMTVLANQEYYRKALDVLSLFLGLNFREKVSNFTKMSLGAPASPPSISAADRWIGLKFQYVFLFVQALQLTVGIHCQSLQSPESCWSTGLIPAVAVGVVAASCCRGLLAEL